jgi:hypothetical protein
MNAPEPQIDDNFGDFDDSDESESESSEEESDSYGYAAAAIIVMKTLQCCLQNLRK